MAQHRASSPVIQALSAAYGRLLIGFILVGAGLALVALRGLNAPPCDAHGDASPTRHALYGGTYGRQAQRNLTRFRSSLLEAVVDEYARAQLEDRDMRYARWLGGWKGLRALAGLQG